MVFYSQFGVAGDNSSAYRKSLLEINQESWAGLSYFGISSCGILEKKQSESLFSNLGKIALSSKTSEKPIENTLKEMSYACIFLEGFSEQNIYFLLSEGKAVPSFFKIVEALENSGILSIEELRKSRGNAGDFISFSEGTRRRGECEHTRKAFTLDRAGIFHSKNQIIVDKKTIEDLFEKAIKIAKQVPAEKVSIKKDLAADFGPDSNCGDFCYFNVWVGGKDTEIHSDGFGAKNNFSMKKTDPKFLELEKLFEPLQYLKGPEPEISSAVDRFAFVFNKDSKSAFLGILDLSGFFAVLPLDDALRKNVIDQLPHNLLLLASAPDKSVTSLRKFVMKNPKAKIFQLDIEKTSKLFTELQNSTKTGSHSRFEGDLSDLSQIYSKTGVVFNQAFLLNLGGHAVKPFPLNEPFLTGDSFFLDNKIAESILMEIPEIKAAFS